jgi:hypothetical protein
MMSKIRDSTQEYSFIDSIPQPQSLISGGFSVIEYEMDCVIRNAATPWMNHSS